MHVQSQCALLCISLISERGYESHAANQNTAMVSLTESRGVPNAIEVKQDQAQLSVGWCPGPHLHNLCVRRVTSTEHSDWLPGWSLFCQGDFKFAEECRMAKGWLPTQQQDYVSFLLVASSLKAGIQ